MALLSKDSGGGEGFEQLEPGAYVARCVSVVDLGIQDAGRWGKKEKVYLGFEVPSERVKWTDKDGNEKEGPAFIGSRYTNSINEKAILGQHLKSWRGKPFTDDERAGFDLFTVLGVPCMISVVHNESGGKMYANIEGIMRLPKGTECPPAETELIACSPMDSSTAANLTKLPEWLQKVVRAGYGIAEGQITVGSEARATAPTSSARDQALAAAHGKPSEQPDQADEDPFDDDIPF